MKVELCALYARLTSSECVDVSRQRNIVPLTLCPAPPRVRQVLKVWDMGGKLLAGPVSLTDFFGPSVTGRFSDAFCEGPFLHPRKTLLRRLQPAWPLGPRGCVY